MTLDLILSIAHIALTVTLAYGAYYSLRNDSPALTVFFGFCFFYLALRGLMLASGFYGVFGILHGGRQLDLAVLPKAILASVLFIVAVLIGYGPVPRKESDLKSMRVMPDARDNLAFAVVWVAALMALILASEVPNLKWVFSFVILGGTFLVLYRPRYYPRILTLSLGFFAITAALDQSVERRDWAIAVASLALVAIVFQSRKVVRLVTLSTVMIATIAFAAIMLRTGSELSVGATVNRLSTDALLPIIEVELDFPLIYDDFVVLLDEVPRTTDFTYGLYFLKPLFSWVSRDIWPDKPDSLSRYYAQELNPHFFSRGGSEPVTLVGELYWNFSYFGLVFAMIIGVLIRQIDDYWRKGRNLLSKLNAIVLATMLFYILRGPMDTFWLAYAFHFAAWSAVATLNVMLQSAVNPPKLAGLDFNQKSIF